MLYLTPASAGALSLGELEVQSRLNAPLQAIIPLSANAAELADLEVGLGTEAAFQRAGIEHDELLYSLRFAVVKHGDAAHILLTSTNVIREPLLEFVMSLRWANGGVLREVAVFLSP